MPDQDMAAIGSDIKKYKENLGQAIKLEQSAIKAVEQEIDSWK